MALTRSRYGLIIIGDATNLKRNVYWSNLLAMLSERGLIYEGFGIGSLRKSGLLFKRSENIETMMG